VTMEIPMLGTDALPHVKLNLAIPVQTLRMFNLYAQRSAEMVTCKVHNQRYVMTEIILEETAAQLLAKLSQDGNVLEQKDRQVFAMLLYVETLDYRQVIQKYVMTVI